MALLPSVSSDLSLHLPVPQAVSPGCHDAEGWEADVVLNLSSSKCQLLARSVTPLRLRDLIYNGVMTVPNSQCEDSMYLFGRGFGL